MRLLKETSINLQSFKLWKEKKVINNLNIYKGFVNIVNNL